MPTKKIIEEELKNQENESYKQKRKRRVIFEKYIIENLIKDENGIVDKKEL